MSTPEQHKQLKVYYLQCDAIPYAWQRGNDRFPPIYPPFLEGLHDQQCGAKTGTGTPCKQKAIFINGRCKWHGGLTTGPKTAEGKQRSAMNGFCPKRKQTHNT